MIFYTGESMKYLFTFLVFFTDQESYYLKLCMLWISTEGTERVSGTITHIADQAAGYQPYTLIAGMRTAIQIPF